MGRLMQVDGPLTGLHAIREPVAHPVPADVDGDLPSALPSGN